MIKEGHEARSDAYAPADGVSRQDTSDSLTPRLRPATDNAGGHDDSQNLSEIFIRAFDDSPEGVQITDLDGHIIYSNKAIERIYGFTPEEQKGKHVSEMNVDREIVREEIVPAIHQAGSWAGEVQVKHKTGREFPVWLSCSVVKDEDGTPIALTGVSRDISERKQIEKALEISEAKYRKLLDLGNDAIFIADVESGLIVETNRKASDLIGRSREEILRMHQAEHHPPEKAAEYRDIFAEYIAKGQGVTMELLVRHASGRDVPVEISSSVIEIEGMRLIKGVFRDLTDRYRAKELSDALNEINAIINSTLDVAEVMQRALDTSMNVCGADSAALLERRNHGWVIKQTAGSSSADIGTSIEFGRLVAGNVAIETKRPVGIGDAQTDDRSNNEMARAMGLRSLLVVPLFTAEQVEALLIFRYFSSRVEFSPGELDFAAKLGATVALARENSRLYNEQQRISNTLQEALLLMPERLPGVDFGHLYRSAMESALVGGDFFDLLALDGDRVGVIIGDVSGKGLEAAAHTSMLKHTIRGYAHEHRSPAEIVSRINTVVMKETDTSTFVTAFIGIIDIKSKELTYCGAGHPPAILRREDGEIELLDTGCGALGIFDRLDAVDSSVALGAGDILTLYTDGVTEARCREGMFGEDRLTAFIAGSEAPVGKLPEKLIEELTVSCECSLADDLAVVTISVRP